jgi:hypothetical protein
VSVSQDISPRGVNGHPLLRVALRWGDCLLAALEWIEMFLDPVPQSEDKGKVWQKILSVATYLLFWIGLSAVGLWLMLEIRELLVELMILASFNPWQVRGIDRWAIFMLGLAWFASMLWIDHYLRTGIGKKRLWRNIGRVTLIEASMAAVVFVSRIVISR